MVRHRVAVAYRRRSFLHSLVDLHLLAAALAGVLLLVVGQTAWAQSSSDNSDDATGRVGQPCMTNHSLLLVASNQLMTDCGYLAWCDPSSNTCAARGCRRDEYPFGYNSVERSKWPKKCDSHQFCPDEGSYCMDKIQLGGACQLNRDDECVTSTQHPIVRCLHNQCVAVNASKSGAACIHENVVYTIFTPDNSSYGSIVSRDNCVTGLYCDSPTSKCMTRKANGQSCAGDKECMTDFCQDTGYLSSTPDNNDATGTCSDQPSLIVTRHSVWLYPVVVLVAIAVVAALFVTLLKVHQSQGKRRRERQYAYWESQRLINEKARIYRDAVGLSSRSTMQFEKATKRSQVGARKYDTNIASQPDEGSQASLLQQPRSLPVSYDTVAFTRSDSGLQEMQRMSSDAQLQLPSSTYATLPPEDSMIFGGHDGQVSVEELQAPQHLRRHIDPFGSSSSMMRSPDSGELYLTPTQSFTSLHASGSHATLSAFHDVDERSAAIRNREAAARSHGWASPDARRHSAAQDWSFAVTEGHSDQH